MHVVVLSDDYPSSKKLVLARALINVRYYLIVSPSYVAFDTPSLLPSSPRPRADNVSRPCGPCREITCIVMLLSYAFSDKYHRLLYHGHFSTSRTSDPKGTDNHIKVFDDKSLTVFRGRVDAEKVLPVVCCCIMNISDQILICTARLQAPQLLPSASIPTGQSRGYDQAFAKLAISPNNATSSHGKTWSVRRLRLWS